MEASEILSGTIDRFLFTQQETGFSIFVLIGSGKESIIVKATLPALAAGQEVTLKGSWVFHPKFGKQFEALSCTACLPTSVVGLKKYLGSGLIRGIGKVNAQRLVDHFGTKILEIIDKNPERLKEVYGIGTKSVERIAQAWQSQKEISSIMVFLQEKDVSPAYATKIYKQYGKESIAILHENPYRIAHDIWGIGFKTADKIAQKLGIAANAPARIQAGICFAITQELERGHIYSEVSELKKKTAELLEFELAENEPKIKSALHELYNQQRIKLISPNEQHFVTLTPYYFSEFGVSIRIKKLLEVGSFRTFDSNAIYQQLRSDSPGTISLTEDQQRAILACLQHKITIITGGPGTGKTTIIKQLLSILDSQKCTYKLAAPTGRAAKRITESTGRLAFTIHRLLDFSPQTMSFSYHEHHALKLEFLIIDEASMIDIFLAHALLKAVPWNAHLVFIGDVDQLPAVGAGNFLCDLIESKKIVSIHLKTIFRQEHNSMITLNAHRINNGEFPTTAFEDAKKDFLYVKENDPALLPAQLQKIFKTILPRYHISRDETIVLVPMNRGIAGTHMLNHHLQQERNLGEPTIAYRGTTYHLRDRVMQIKNNYDKQVFNGDMGFITAIDLEEKTIMVEIDDHQITYEYDELNELVLAYAVTVHKSQGSEYKAVIVPLFMQHFMLLQRNLLYTAITRARSLCIFVGQAKAIAIAIKNNKTSKRTTFLKEYLTTDLVCR